MIHKMMLGQNPPICDFCSSPFAPYRYSCESFAVPEFRVTSEGDWAACEVCKKLVEKGDREALLTRSIATLSLGKHGISIEDVPGVREMTRRLHQGFFLRQKGLKK